VRVDGVNQELRIQKKTIFVDELVIFS